MIARTRPASTSLALVAFLPAASAAPKAKVRAMGSKIRLSWVLGGAVMALMSGFGAMACSLSAGAEGEGVDSLRSAGELSVDGKKKDAGVDCGPTSTLFPEHEAGVYCPYSYEGDSGDKTCAAGEVCCQAAVADDAGVFPVSECRKKECKGTSVITWECEGPKDCADSKAGPVCCGYGTPETNGPSCTNYTYVSGATDLGTVCAASCTAGTQTIICDKEKGKECPSGTTCTPVRYHGNQVGYCL